MSTAPTLTARQLDSPEETEADEVWALVILWSHDEPERVGEVMLVPEGQTWQLGRGDGLGEGESGAPRLQPVQQRPRRSRATGPLMAPRISRHQLDLRASESGLDVGNRGRLGLLVDGQARATARVGRGCTLELESELLLGVCRRPRRLPEARSWPHRPHPFGSPDAHGMVGESPAAWRLREQLAFVAARPRHVLVRGESGTGKELVAQALHAEGRRARGPLVSRSAATIPEGLVDAELFGNVRDYPNPGMRDRPGLLGEADGGTLFLDEFAELSEAMQAHLLRVMDSGEYHRLGESRARTADVRLVAATNRPDAAFKHDVLARFPIRLHLPGLGERAEDLPLLTRHLLQGIAAADPQLARRWFDGDQPRLSPRLVAHLWRRPWHTHVRELEALLWQALLQSEGRYLDLPAEARDAVASAPTAPSAAAPATAQEEAEARDPGTVSRDELVAAMAEHDGVKSQVWRALGLANRYVLRRLLDKHGL